MLYSPLGAVVDTVKLSTVVIDGLCPAPSDKASLPLHPIPRPVPVLHPDRRLLAYGSHRDGGSPRRVRTLYVGTPASRPVDHRARSSALTPENFPGSPGRNASPGYSGFDLVSAPIDLQHRRSIGMNVSPAPIRPLLWRRNPKKAMACCAACTSKRPLAAPLARSSRCRWQATRKR